MKFLKFHSLFCKHHWKTIGSKLIHDGRDKLLTQRCEICGKERCRTL